MKIVVVTGAHEGIGKACCLKLSEQGYRIVGIDIVSEVIMRESLRDIENSIELLIGNLEVSGEMDIAKKLAGILPSESWSVLVNALASNRGGGIYDSTPGDWNMMMNTNLVLPYQLSQIFAHNCRDNKISGSIVNISSMVGLIGAKKPGYAASRAGIFGLTKSIAMQLGPDVRCNLIYTGAVNDLMHSDWNEEKRRKVESATPIGRLAEPDEIATIVTFLADDKKSGFLTGAMINATGGQYLGQ